MERLRRAMRHGMKRVILSGPTGSGKTEMSIQPILGVVEKGKKATFLADRIALVQQTSMRFRKYGIQHGVAQAENTMGRLLPIQVMSAQTLESRGYWDEEIDLLVIDECHAKRKKVLALAQAWGGYVIGLSATPITKGLGEFWDGVVSTATTTELLNTINPATGRPYLCPVVFYAGREINMTGAAINDRGEWKDSEVTVRGRAIIGNVVPEWVKRTNEHFGGPVPTLVFSRSIQQGEELCKAFIDAGYDFRQSTYKDSADDTAGLVASFAEEEFHGLVSVDKHVKGYDNPGVKCIIDCNPRRTSLAPLLQGIGREMRDMDGKTEAIYIDHAGNLAGWFDDIMEFWDFGVSTLDNTFIDRVRKEGRERKEVVCPQCGRVLASLAKTGGICPGCGWAKPRQPVRSVPGYTERVDPEPAKPPKDGTLKWNHSKEWTWAQLSKLYLQHKKGDREKARKAAAGRFKAIFDEWPPWSWDLAPTAEPVHEDVRKRMQALNIRWAKGKGRKAKGG